MGWQNKARVRAILSGTDERLGRSIAFFIQCLIVLSAVAVAVETMPDLPGWLRTALVIEEALVLGIFSVEYLLRLWSAENRARYAFGFWGIIDLAAILPSLIIPGTDLRTIRTLRLLRLLRLLKLVRYSRAADRLAKAFFEVRSELVLFLFVAIIVIYLCATGIYFFEHEAQPDAFASIPHSLWWAIATLSTVGYGDVYPITAGGRIFTFFVLLVGVGIVAVPTSLLATALAEARRNEDLDDRSK